MSTHPNSVPVSVVIPTYQRVAQLQVTLEAIFQCDPQPLEVIVHADAGDHETVNLISRFVNHVRFLQSSTRQGPGGGRNRLVEGARCEYIASFDDDSWPLSKRFFAEAVELLDAHSEFALIACNIRERGESSRNEEAELTREGTYGQVTEGTSFVGCGCIFRRSAFLNTSGYLPLADSYGMEEADLSLQMLDQNVKLGFSPHLLVYHDCNRSSHHANPQINAAQITNTALLAYLRYPISYWPFGFLQTVNRVRFAMLARRFAGIPSGIAKIPVACWQYRKCRRPVKASTISKTRRILRNGRSER